MAKKVKASKTTTAKKKEKVAKPRAPREEQPELVAEAQAEGEVQVEASAAPSPEPRMADVPTVAPSVAVATRNAAPVPAAVREGQPEPPAPVAPPEPMVTEPPPMGILAILNVKTEAEADVSLKNLTAYRGYLEKYLERPVGVRGREPFGWERPYAWGLRDRAAYDQRRATCPSYLDDLEIVGFEEDVDTTDGITVRVSRPADGRTFILALDSLKSVDPASGNASILDEFALWLSESR